MCSCGVVGFFLADNPFTFRSVGTLIVEVRYLRWGEKHIASHVHKHIFDNLITFLQARVIRAVMRYAECVMISQGDTQCLST